MLEINQFTGMKFSDCVQPEDESCPRVVCFETGEQLLDALGIPLDQIATDYLALGITFLILSITGYYGCKLVTLAK